MASTRLDVAYATDEDLWLIGSSDWAILVPQSQTLAGGADGELDAGGWVLTSTATDFEAQGVAAGHIVRLSSPRSTFRLDQFLAVESVSGGEATLRRPGLAAGVGMPPSAAALDEITFDVRTFDPQLENAAYEMHQRFAVDPSSNYRAPGDIYDQRVFRELCCLWVLYREYMQGQRTEDGDFPIKARNYKILFEEALSKAQLRWGSDGDAQPPTSKFGMRLVRG